METAHTPAVLAPIGGAVLGAVAPQVGTGNIGSRPDTRAVTPAVARNAKPVRPVLSVTTTVSRSSLRPKEVSTVITTVRNTGAPLVNGIVDLEMYSSAGKRVSQKVFAGQSIAAGGSSHYTYTWPAATIAGLYTLEVGIFGPKWTPLLFWSSNAAHISVGGMPAPTVSVTASLAPAAPTTGKSATIHASVRVTSGVLVNGIVDVEVHSAAGAKVSQRYFDRQSIKAGQSVRYNVAWTPKYAGAYVVSVGVFGELWTQGYAWEANAAAFTVTGTMPPVVREAVTVTPVRPAHGSTLAIHAKITLSSGNLIGGIVDVEVYDSGGKKVGQMSFTNQTIHARQSASFDFTWRPVARDTYTVSVGVFGANWAPSFFWGKVAKISVS